MKKFVLKVTAYFLGVCLVAILPCIIIDPYSVFHPLSVTDNGVEPNKNYTKMVYIRKNPELFDSFIFGSSLAGMVNAENIPDSKCYNMTHSGGVLPEFEANLRTLLKAGIVPEKLYVGLETGSYSDVPENRTGDRMRVSYEYSRTNPLDFWGLYIDPAVNIDALRTVISANNKSELEKQAYTNVFYSNGGYPFYGFTWEFDRDEAADALRESKKRMAEAIRNESIPSGHALYMDEALDSMRNIVEICNANGIELTVFICPVYYETFEKAVVENGFLTFLEELADITPYYNFCGFNAYTTDPSCYHEDRAHFLVELGDIMIDAMCRGSCSEELLSEGFGMRVDGESYEGLYTVLTDINRYL